MSEPVASRPPGNPDDGTASEGAAASSNPQIQQARRDISTGSFSSAIRALQTVGTTGDLEVLEAMVSLAAEIRDRTSKSRERAQAEAIISHAQSVIWRIENPPDATVTSSDAPIAGAKADDQKTDREEPNLVGAGVALLAALLILIGTFLPIHSYGTLPIASNSFVADGDWWILILPLTIGITAVYRIIGATSRGTWAILIASVIAIGVGIYGQTSSFQKLTLNPTIQSITGVTTVKGSAGPGVYLVLAGGIVGFVAAGLLLGIWRPFGVPAYGRRTKRCPDCAETVQAEARVCKHCGYRFGET